MNYPSDQWPENRLTTLLQTAKKCRILAVLVWGVAMGYLTYKINWWHGHEEAMNAAWNQAIHSTISAAWLMWLYSQIVKKYSWPWKDVASWGVPALLTIVICYLIHKCGISVEFLESQWVDFDKLGIDPVLREPSKEAALSTVPTAVVISVVMPVYHFIMKRTSFDDA